MRGFLGVINYLKKSIPDLKDKEIPLLSLPKKGVKWKWSQECERAFQDIEQQFLKQLKIYHPNYNIPFILRTDASVKRLAGMLSQIRNKVEVPIAFVSRTTKPHEKN